MTLASSHGRAKTGAQGAADLGKQATIGSGSHTGRRQPNGKRHLCQLATRVTLNQPRFTAENYRGMPVAYPSLSLLGSGDGFPSFIPTKWHTVSRSQREIGTLSTIVVSLGPSGLDADS